MSITRFSSIRARLLALMLLVLAPIAVLCMLLAANTHRTVSRGLEMSQMELASNYAVRTRVWFRGWLRMMIATAATMKAQGVSAETCSAELREVASAVNGLQAANFTFGNGATCTHSAVSTLDPAAIKAELERQRGRAQVTLWAGPELGETRYDAVRINGALHLVTYTRITLGENGPAELLVMMDPKLLDQAFDIGVLDEGDVVALVRRGGDIVISRGADETDRTWLPSDLTPTLEVSRVMARDQSGATHAYASLLVIEPDLHILARFDNAASQSAFTQFLVLALTPLAVLITMFLAFYWAINRDLVRWIAAIETAARERLAGGFTRAPTAPEMPDELGRVAQAYNSLIDDVEARETDLKQSLARNTDLMRELNHRVKNSLQVIQSYLAISRRQSRKTVAVALLETEAKVLVLSSAYRLALREGMLHPVTVKPFVEEIVANLSAHLRGPEQWIDIKIADDMFPLIVDRAIPLGLAIVEAVSAGLKADACKTVSVTIAREDDVADLTVGCDGPLSKDVPPARIMAGLAAQIEAEQLAASGAGFLHWRLKA
jgi:two-component sensor histidine kinase